MDFMLLEERIAFDAAGVDGDPGDHDLTDAPDDSGPDSGASADSGNDASNPETAGALTVTVRILIALFPKLNM